jgi:hypothetical protein
MTLDELTQTLRMAAVNENTITAMTNAYNLGFEAGREAQPKQLPENCGTGHCSCIECLKK